MKRRSWYLALGGVLVVIAACSDGATDSTQFQQPASVADAATTDAQPTVCCLAACGPIFQVSFAPVVDDAKLQQSTFAVCRNAECFETTLANLALPTGSGLGQSVELSSSPYIDLVVFGRDSVGTPRRMIVDYRPTSALDWKDGDTYELTLKDDAGAVLHHLQTAVTYTTSEYCCQTCATAVFDGGT